MQYLLLIYEPEADPAVSAPPVDYAPWIAYTEWLRGEGILRGGDELAPSSAATSVRVRDGRTLVTDGPFAETKEFLGGYYLIECADLDIALAAAARCPGATHGTIEVRPIVAMPPDPDAG
jgi:hypothetical protein